MVRPESGNHAPNFSPPAGSGEPPKKWRATGFPEILDHTRPEDPTLEIPTGYDMSPSVRDRINFDPSKFTPVIDPPDEEIPIFAGQLFTRSDGQGRRLVVAYHCFTGLDEREKTYAVVHAEGSESITNFTPDELRRRISQGEYRPT